MFDMVENLVQESEGITPDILSMVDLEIAYSPVIVIVGEGIEEAVEAVKTKGGKYLVRHPMVHHAVSAEDLKVMRCRYLLARGQRCRRF